MFKSENLPLIDYNLLNEQITDFFEFRLYLAGNNSTPVDMTVNINTPYTDFYLIY